MCQPERRRVALADRGPLRVLFVTTSMPVGGAETLLVNLVRRIDREQFLPEICCLKEPGPLGELLAAELPVHARLLSGKYDLRVLGRLVRLLRDRRIDALVTVGAGDKMFWGRLAARRAGLPVVLSAIHSTGWPDQIGRLNRWLARWTDGFIAVARDHGRYLAEVEGFGADKVRVIPNGVDTERFRPRPDARRQVRDALGIPADAPVIGIVAALRPEKDHALFLTAAHRLRTRIPSARFVVVGDGPERGRLERLAAELDLADGVHFLGTRGDVECVLAALDVFSLSSRNEANPVSILEALAVELPVVAPRVGSIPEVVVDGETGFLVPPGDAAALADAWERLAADPAVGRRQGQAGRFQVMQFWSLDQMVRGYQELIAAVYTRKCPAPATFPSAGWCDTMKPIQHETGFQTER